MKKNSPTQKLKKTRSKFFQTKSEAKICRKKNFENPIFQTSEIAKAKTKKLADRQNRRTKSKTIQNSHFP